MGGDGQKSFGPKIAPLVVGNYCIQHKGIYLSSLVKKYEQTGGRRGTLKILAQLKLRTNSLYQLPVFWSMEVNTLIW